MDLGPDIRFSLVQLWQFDSDAVLETWYFCIPDHQISLPDDLEQFWTRIAVRGG